LAVIFREAIMRAGSGHHRFLQVGRVFRRRALTTALAALALAGAAGALEASPPPPPRRPNEIGKPPAPAKPSPKPAPQTTAPAGRAPVDIDVNKLEPYNLPPASREKMHQCGDEWRKLKLAGKSEGLIWRSFAATCLTR
jgi:hypothetical protein